jgi:cytochrome c oxidase assembly factor CtaG
MTTLTIVTPSNWPGAWSLEPTVSLPLLLVAAVYATGTLRLWRRAGIGHGVGTRQVISFGAGLIVIGLALLSPLDAVADELVSAHMVQHLLLIVVAPPLLVLGAPYAVLLWAIPRSQRRPLAQALRRVHPAWVVFSAPLVVVALNVAVIWVWHLPALYDAAVQNDLVHGTEHACFLGASLLLWWTLVHAGERGRPGYGSGIVIVFITAMQSTILGALFTFARTPWYPIYLSRTDAWHLTPLQDQQLAGVIMWIPAGSVYIGAVCVLFLAWLRAVERRVETREADRLIAGGEAV